MSLVDLPPWLWRVFGPLFGLLWGSFINVVVHRHPRGMSVVHPPSHCPGCNQPVRPYDNIPVFSWLLLRGRARCCGVAISPRYPLVEAAGGLLAWAVVETQVLTLSPDTPAARALAIYVAYLAFALGLLAASFIDLEHFYVPDEISLGGTLVGFATATLRDSSWVESGVGALAGFLVVWLPFDVLYRRLRGRTGMAMGDAKLVMMAGAWFGWTGALFALVAGAAQGLVGAGLLWLLSGKVGDPQALERERAAALAEIEALPEAERAEARAELDDDPLFQPGGGGLGSRLAFGPFLALAMLERLFFGPPSFLRLLEP
ncbi:MAG: prepilin peptidase [Polyangiaceae bacterium]|jgi:leader peptidase (prepilin peptidase)/N-methyltransferase|nr:prepilin peptidase [Polyangiaceae bacterium]